MHSIKNTTNFFDRRGLFRSDGWRRPPRKLLAESPAHQLEVDRLSTPLTKKREAVLGHGQMTDLPRDMGAQAFRLPVPVFFR